MKFRFIKIFTFLFFFIPFVSQSQVKEHFDFPNNSGFVENGSYWVLRDSIFRYDLNTEEVFTYKPIDRFPNLVYLTDSGLYYSASHFVDDIRRSTLFFLSMDFKNHRQIQSFAKISAFKEQPNGANFYFLGTSLNDISGLWKSDGTVEGTILEKEDNLIGTTNSLFIDNNFIYHNTTNNKLDIRVLGQSSPIALNKEYRSVDVMRVYNNKAYFLARQQNNLNNDLYVLDETLSATLLIEDLPLLNLYPIYSDTLYFDRFDFLIRQYSFLYFDTKNNTLDTLKLDKRLNGGPQIRDYLNHNYLVFRHPAIGKELARISGDSLVLVADFNKGPTSGVKQYYMDPNNLSFYYQISPKGVFSGDTLYTIMSNGNNVYEYYYRITGKDIVCMSEVGELEGLSFMYQDRAYYVKFVGRTNHVRYALFSKRIDEGSKQPLQKIEKENQWYKQFSYYRENSFHDYRSRGRVFSTHIDKKGEIIMLWSTERSDFITPPDTFDPIKMVTNNVVKVDAKGKVKWVCRLGAIYEGSSTGESYHRMVLDSKGDVYVVGFNFLNGIMGNDSIFNVGQNDRVKYFIAKINGDNGDLLWYKFLYESEFIGPYLDALTIDKEDNLYLAMIARQSPFVFGGNVFKSDLLPQNAIVKFDSSGNILWIKPMTTPWTDTYGRTNVFGFDNHKKRIVSQQSQGSPNWQTPCKYRNWGNVTQYANLNGDAEITSSYFSNDLGWIQTGILDDKGALHSFGKWRGGITVTAIFPELTTLIGRDCNEYESYYTITDPNVGIPVELFRTNNVLIEPVSAKFDNGHVYLLASINGIAYLFKFKNDGAYVGYKNLEFYLSGNTVIPRISFDVKDGSIVISGAQLSQSSVLGIPKYISFMPYFSVAKFPDSDWSNDTNWFERVTPIDNDKQRIKLFVFPNPTNDFIKIAYDKEKAFTHFEIINIQGQLIRKGVLEEAEDQISMANLASGIYIIRIVGDGISEAAKVVKY